MDLLDIALSSMDFITCKEKIVLKKSLCCVDELCSITRNDLSYILGRTIKTQLWNGEKTVALAEKDFRILERLDIRGTVFGEDDFPSMLFNIYDPPYMVFYRGDLSCLKNRCVSVVGTRRVCPDCAKSTQDFSQDCAYNGMTVVSGLAYGVDSFAHRGALYASGGLTCGVLPCGIDTISPSGNKGLAKKILERDGLLLSEYLPGVPSEAWRYVKRNRLVAALSPVTVVTQAPPGSGALITADFALGYNRYLMFHENCFCSDAKFLTEKSIISLKAKKTKAALFKIQHSCENYVKDGAQVFKDYEDFIEKIS